MADVKSFSSYLNDARKKYGVSQPTQKPLNYTPLPKGTFKEKQKPQDPLSWFVDILSRPMRIVQNTVNVAATESKKRATEGANYDVLGGIGNQLAAPLTGFFSTDEQFQPTGSDIIENVTDAFGLNTDRNYKDVQDNVNPVAKGIGGFAIDVASDPLTYVPGGIATSFIRGGIKGGQAVAKGAQVTKELAKTAEVAGDAGVKAVAATESAAKPFASNVVAGILKGAVQGVPNTSAVGTFSKALKPVGLAEWGQRRAYDKVFSAGKRLGVSAEDLIKVAKDPTYAAKAAAASTKNVDADKILSVSQRISKNATKAEVWTDKLSAQFLRRPDIAAVSNAIDELTRDMPEGSTVKTEKPLVAAETIAQKGSVEDAKTFADSILTRQAAADTPTPTQTADINTWLRDQVVKANAAGTHAVAHGPASVGTRQIPAGRIKNAELRSLAKIYDVKNGKLVPKAGVKYDVAQMVDLNAKIEVAYAKYLEDFAQASGVAAKNKASRKIMDLITGQIDQARLAFGDEAVKILEATNEVTRAKAVKYLAEALSSVENGDEIGKFGATVRDKFTKAVFQHLGMDVPGTTARQIPSAGTLNDPINLEAASLADEGKTLMDYPEFAGMSEDDVRSVVRALTGWSDEFLDLAGFPHMSKKGARKAKAAFGEGRAKWDRQLNTPDQTNLITALLREPLEKIKTSNVTAKNKDKNVAEERALEVVQTAINTSRLVFGWLNSKGITGVLGLNDNFVHLYADQVLDTLLRYGKAKGNLSTLLAAIGNNETSVPLGNILNAVLAKQINPAITKDELFAILKEPIVLKDATKKMPPNVLNSGQRSNRRFGYFPGKTEPNDSGYYTWVKNPKNVGYYRVMRADKIKQFGDDLVSMIDGTADDMGRLIKSNNDNMASRITNETHFMSDEAWTILNNAVKDQEALFESLDILANPRKWFEQMSKLNKNTAAAVRNSVELLKSRASAIWQTEAARAAQDVRTAKAGTGSTKSPRQQAADTAERHAKNTAGQGRKVKQDAANHEAQLSPDAYGEAISEFDQLEHQVDRGLFNWLRAKFSRQLGVEDVLQNFDDASAAFNKAHAGAKVALNNLHRKYVGPKPLDASGTSVLGKAWYDWINNVDSDDTAAARKEIQELMDVIIGPPGPDQMANSLFRGISMNSIEASLARARLPLEIDYDLIEEWAKFDKISLEEAFLKHIKELVGSSENPIEVIEALHYAGASSQMARGAASLFANIPGAVVFKPTKGYSRISEDVNPFENPLIYFLPKNTFINDEIIGQVSKLEKIMASPRLPGGDIGKIITDYYVAPLAAWKGAVTIMRPGHHIRNFISSYFLQAQDLGGRNLNKSVKMAARVLSAARGKNSGSGPLDYTKFLTNLEELPTAQGLKQIPRKEDILFTHPKFGPITVGMIDEAGLKKGLYTPSSISEDIALGGTSNKASRFIERVTFQKGKLGDAGRWASQYQNDINRVSYFLQYVLNEGQKGYYKSWDDLASAAASNSRRVNPDGSMLTNFEQKYMRLLIPFYAWNRRVLPEVMGMIADQPARFMLLPKASYNLAVAMGVNPESMQEPFPEDQLFPEFITSQLLGPVLKINGKYFSVAPGFAQADVLNTFIGDPGSKIPGMVTPFLRVPAELLAGAKWGSTAKINDLSDYIDSNLPLVNYLSNFSGTSVTGSLASLLQGTGLDPQSQVFKENRGPLEQSLSAGSWLLGIGAQNLSQPNLINYAEIEKRNRAAEEEPGTKNPF